ncbi:MAG: transglutaminase-like domain-containing protein [Planctomycetota bacterium]
MRFLMLSVVFLCVGCAQPPGREHSPGLSTGKVGNFDVQHNFAVTVPNGAEGVDIWFAVPNQNDRMQSISDWKVEPAGLPARMVRDRLGNPFLYLHLDNPEPGEFHVDTSFKIERYEVNADLDPSKTRPHTAEELAELSIYLKGSSQSVINGDVIAMARKVVGTEKNPVIASRSIYDAILDHVEYHVKDPKPNVAKTMNPTGTGNSRLCYASCTGNCTDFHSLYAAVSRAAGIPTRAVYGSFFKGPLSGVDKDQSYHCWIEFHAPNLGWIPLDVAVADIFVDSFQANEHSQPRANLTVANGYAGPDPKLVNYYFGNLEERRVTWHWGRDLEMVDPRQKGEPLLWNPKAYAEVDGQAASIVKRKLTYHEIGATQAAQ